MIEPGMRMPPADAGLAVTEKYTEAVNLNAKILVSAQVAQQSLYDMCIGLKKMRDDKLYKELGYSDFGDYCEKETGMKRSNVYNYIVVVEKLPNDFVQSIGQRVGMTKLQLLTTLNNEQRESIAETTDLENTTVKELKAKIDSIKKQNDVLHEEMKYREEEHETESQKYKDKITELEKEIKDLESRPIDVAVETDSREIANLKDAMKRVDLDWSQKYSELEEENLKCRRELMQKAEQAEKDKQDRLSELRTELEKTKAEYEQKLAPKTSDEMKVKFKIYLTSAYDAMKRLVEFTKANSEPVYVNKVKQLVQAVEQELEEEK